jgi:hypothetical protein
MFIPCHGGAGWPGACLFQHWGAGGRCAGKVSRAGGASNGPGQLGDQVADAEQLRRLMTNIFGSNENELQRDQRFNQRLRWPSGRSTGGVSPMEMYIGDFIREVAATSGEIPPAVQIKYFLAGLGPQTLLAALIQAANPQDVVSLLPDRTHVCRTS